MGRGISPPPLLLLLVLILLFLLIIFSSSPILLHRRLLLLLLSHPLHYSSSPTSFHVLLPINFNTGPLATQIKKIQRYVAMTIYK